MRIIPKTILTLTALFIVSILQARNYFQQNDTTIDEGDCYAKFFERSEKVPSPAKTILVMKTGKTTSVAALMNASDTLMELPQYGLADLDNDGKKELVIFNYSGGAHCCDVFYFFKNIAPGKYQYVAETFAGDLCITDKNEFPYDFYQQFGYFFTCFACEYQDSSETAPIAVHNIVLKYNRGKLTVVPGDKDLRSAISDNLGKLGEQPYQKLQDEADQDNGLRKEFAFNLAVFYYSFGRNIAETKKLFDKYYKYPDAKKVWTAFANQLQHMRKDNDF